jgi:cullin 3
MSKGKITIKPFRNQVQMDPNYADNTWKLLKNAIHEIHKQNASGLSFEELYRNAYNMVLHKYGDKLYQGLRQAVHDHLVEVSQKVAASVDEDFLPELNRAWNDHKMSMLMIRDILMYMDRVYVMHHNVPTVYDLGLILFLENVARAPGIKDRMLSIVLASIEAERCGERVDASLLKSVTSMLVDLGVSNRSVYEEDFERHFLQTSARFYRIESQQFIASCGCPDYLRKAEQRRAEEAARVAHYLDRSTGRKIREVVERELIEAHMQTLVEMEGTGLVSLLRARDKIDDLERMYRLFNRVAHGHKLMRDTIAEHVRAVGKQIVTAAEPNPSLYIQQIIELRDKYNELLDVAFLKDKDFTKAFNSAFESFVNLNRRSPEYISLFIDEKLRRGFQGMSDDQMELTLRKVMDVFRFVQEKDVFEKYYKQHLARRLLLGRTISHDAEKTMIQNLKCECGYQFTSKLEGMFNDMRQSADIMEGFKQYQLTHQQQQSGGGKSSSKGKGKSSSSSSSSSSSPAAAPIDLNVQVLTTGFWPTQSSGQCTLPAVLVECCANFESYYLASRGRRRLTWQTNMGTADIQAQFKKRRHLLSVSTYQMVILLAFRSGAKHTYAALRDITGIPEVDLQRNLLLLARVKILLKHPRVKKALPDDTFTFNFNFATRYHRVKIMGASSSSARTDSDQRAATEQSVTDDRKHAIDAAVVRILKARKTIDHAQLTSEVVRQLSARFHPTPVLIKKRIESLIERDYLERDKNDRKIYRYLA